MNKRTLVLGLLFVFLLASPASAGIEWINGDVCRNDCRKFEVPFVQGKTTTYELKGPWLDYVNKVEGLGSGMTVTQLERHLLQARLTLSLKIDSNAAGGKRTLKLLETGRDLLGNPFTKVHDTLDIYVVRTGTFSAPDIWPVPNYFNEATLIVTGQKLGSAELELAGWPQGTTATLVSSIPPPMDNVAQIRLRFPTYLAEAAGDILLHDKGMPSVCNNLLSTYSYKIGDTGSIWKRVKVQGQNAVKSITFPGGPTFNSGATATIRLTFYRPIAPEGAVIYWRLSTKDGPTVARAVSPTIYDANAQFNQQRVNAGATYVDLTVRICGCPGGVWSVAVSTLFGSTENSTGPGFKASSFSVSCPAGGVACP